jgi:hypothetical protein
MPTMNVTTTAVTAAALAATVPPQAASGVLAAGQLLADGAAALLGSRGPDLITTLVNARAPAAKTASGGKAASASTAAGTPKPTSSGKAASAGKATPKATGYAAGASGDFAFLKDPKLSVEEKLFRFLCAVAQKSDDDLLKKMEEMKGGSTAGPATGAAAKPRAFSLWGAAKALLPPLKLASKLIGDAGVKSLLKQVSGPVLAAACTALGMPMLAPLAAKVGPQLVGSVAEAVESAVDKASGAAAGSGSGGTPASGSTAASGSSGTGSAKNEQLQMMELQRLVDKQKEMFSLVSNILRATHDTRMAVIGNVR